MPKLYVISGPCGCGKTTFSDALASDLARRTRRTVYVVHGDSFHAGFVEPDDDSARFENGLPADRVAWEDILRFNWGCILDTAGRALGQGLDVIIDYVIEGELSRIRDLARAHRAELIYVVLTAAGDEIPRRLRARGDPGLIERSLFLKRKLEAMPENRGRLLDTTGKDVQALVRAFDPGRYLLEASPDPAGKQPGKERTDDRE